MHDTTHTQITDPYTGMYEAVFGLDDEPTVTAEPCHLYTTETDALLYYFASDRTWWTIDEDTGATAPAERPSSLEPGEEDLSYFERWHEAAGDNGDASEWSELVADQNRINAAKEAIESTAVGYAGVIGRDGWGMCIVAAGTTAEVTGAIRAHALESGDSPERVMAAFNVRPVARRYKAAWSLDKATEFTLRTVDGSTIVDLTDDALGAW